MASQWKARAPRDGEDLCRHQFDNTVCKYSPAFTGLAVAYVARRMLTRLALAEVAAARWSQRGLPVPALLDACFQSVGASRPSVGERPIGADCARPVPGAYRSLLRYTRVTKVEVGRRRGPRIDVLARTALLLTTAADCESVQECPRRNKAQSGAE